MPADGEFDEGTDGDAYSETVAVSTQSGPPMAPGDVSASVGDEGQVTLSWTIPTQPSWVGAVTSMMVDRSDSRAFDHVAEVDWERGITAYSAIDESPWQTSQQLTTVPVRPIPPQQAHTRLLPRRDRSTT